jgi:hypothetical protein
MNAARCGHQAALQPDGKVLVYTGGFNDVTGGWDVTKIHKHELYDPATGEWTAIPNK